MQSTKGYIKHTCGTYKTELHNCTVAKLSGFDHFSLLCEQCY